MKILKGSFVIGLVFVFALLVSPVAAQLESIMGKSIEGPEFIKIKANPNPSYATSDSYIVVHRDEIVDFTADPSIGNATLKYNLNLTNGNKLVLTKEVFEAALAQLDYVEMKY